MGRSDHPPDRSPTPEPPDGPDADPETVARELVLRQLTVSARTRTELERALAKRRVPEPATAAVLDRMTELGLVDDAAFARQWVTSRQSRRHLSKAALRRELSSRGVDADHIHEAVSQVAPDDEHAAARALAEKKLRGMAPLDPEVRYRRLAGALARRGFAPALCATVLREVLSAPEEVCPDKDSAVP